MRRVLFSLFFICSTLSASEWKPTEVEKSVHRSDVYGIAVQYLIDTFNLQVEEVSSFDAVRFNSRGVWGNFEARIKDLGDDRFEVQGWVTAYGLATARVRWSVHLRYRHLDPERWRYMRVGSDLANEPEVLGWKIGDYWSIGYKAEYADSYLAQLYAKR